MTTKPTQLGWALLLRAIRWGSATVLFLSTIVLASALFEGKQGNLKFQPLNLQTLSSQMLRPQQSIIIQVAQDPITTDQPRSRNAPNYQSILGMILLGGLGFATNLLHPSRRTNAATADHSHSLTHSSKDPRP
jgi:hypothetical protein